MVLSTLSLFFTLWWNLFCTWGPRTFTLLWSSSCSLNRRWASPFGGQTHVSCHLHLAITCGVFSRENWKFKFVCVCLEVSLDDELKYGKVNTSMHEILKPRNLKQSSISYKCWLTIFRRKKKSRIYDDKKSSRTKKINNLPLENRKPFPPPRSKKK